MNTELPVTLALTKVGGIGGVIFRQLINKFGTVENILNTSKAKLLKVEGLGPQTVENLILAKNNLPWAEQQIKLANKEGINICSYTDPKYPIRLKRLYDAPPILYIKGESNLNIKKTIAIVGTRKPTIYGKEICDKIVEGFKDQNVCIISGLAYGIDIAAHKSALNHKILTYAVLANSLEGVYPAAHKTIANEIIKSGGCLISENPIGVKAVPSFFLARNRIIAGLADCLILVESAIKGGGMVTATMALNYNKEVYAVPGNLHGVYSAGPNTLIQNNQAKLFTDVNELLKTLNWENNEQPSNKINELDLSQFTKEESLILSLLKQNKEAHIDQLAWDSKLTLNKIASLLLNLEFQDLVKALPGKKFKLK